ncbi:MAG: hypothetical protein A3E85_04880 [Gammaproteobacteria bacterium RIFCSPHIGHO2_12_FULL_45_12]|nr:MAG: hypothetical protein A3E85_04880 [Gammaproteobacteria bacterium RIFCSPHIGHO2_12_FULL_45_12]
MIDKSLALGINCQRFPLYMSRWGIPKGEIAVPPFLVQAKALLLRSIKTRKPFAMGDSKGGDRSSPPFGASKSVAFAQHKNKEAIPAFFSGNG